MTPARRGLGVLAALILAAGCTLTDDEEAQAPTPPPPTGVQTWNRSDLWRPTIESDCGRRLPESPRKGGFYLYFGCEPRQAGPLINAAAARRLPGDAATPEGALGLLLHGPNRAERRAGFYSNFGPKTKDIPYTVTVEDDLAVVDLDPAIMNVELAFVSVQEVAEITSTVGQFPPVERVEIRVGGRPLCKVVGEC